MTLAMVFPGQGAQSVGMLAELAERYVQVSDTFAEAAAVLGYDLWDLVQNGPAERLGETVVTQPAMLTAGVATWRVWRSLGGTAPDHMAGHSLGEYTALVCADALPFVDAVHVVKRRAELMQSAVPVGKGAMVAILGLDDDSVIEVCRRAAEGQVVSAVNFNSPGQVIIAGDRAAVERATAFARTAGAKHVLVLSVSVPSHCELMHPAADELAQCLAAVPFSTPSLPVIGNADMRVYKDVDGIRAGLAKQLYSPVRWTDTIRDLVRRGSSRIVECGPGTVLTRLSKRIDRTIPAICIDNPESMSDALEVRDV